MTEHHMIGGRICENCKHWSGEEINENFSGRKYRRCALSERPGGFHFEATFTATPPEYWCKKWEPTQR